MFGALVRYFPIVCGRPFRSLKFCFSGWALWCFNFQYGALAFFHFLASPWIAFWGAGSGRARRRGSTASVGSLRSTGSFRRPTAELSTSASLRSMRGNGVV